MRLTTAVAAGILTLAFVAPAAAQSHSYRRGYHDCLDGRYDAERDNRAYREGCHAARREREERWGNGPPPRGDFGGPDERWEGERRPPPGYAPPQRDGYGAPPYRAPRRSPALPNVRGMESFQAVAALAAVGYQQVGSNNFGAAVVAFYFNRATGGCLQVVYAKGRASEVQPTSNPSCR